MSKVLTNNGIHPADYVVLFCAGTKRVHGKTTNIPPSYLLLTSSNQFWRLVLNMTNPLICAESKKCRPFTVIVEGNIGCGKTTFLDYFKKYTNICILSEPIELWRNCKGHNLLGHMYSDPKNWSFTFQSYVQLTMLQHHTLPTNFPVKLMERSIYSARYCFVEKMKRDGLLSKPSATVIDEWFQWLIQNTPINVDLVVYLRSSPEIVHERIKKRNRSEEMAVPLEYLEQLHHLHEEWLYYKTLYHCPAPVLTIDANLDISSIAEEYEKCEPHILNKLPLRTSVGL